MAKRTDWATAGELGTVMLELAQRHGFSPPQPSEASRARAVAMTLMGHEVATVHTFLSILDVQPASTLVFREAGEVTGVVATLLLRGAAEPTLRAGDFNGLSPAPSFLAGPDDPSPIYYLWGIAGATKTASSAVMELSRQFRYRALADLTAYALAATPVGRHVGVTQLGFRPVRTPDDALLVSASVAERLAA